MSFMRFNDDLALAMVWLTRLPVSFPDGAMGRTLGQAAWAFPLVGLVLGGFALTTGFAAATLGASPLLAAALAVAAMVLMTGGLHEDGLADFCDGLGARGGQDRRLAAMHDSAIGSYGVLALIIVLGLRVLALGAVGEPFFLILVCMFSRTWMVHVMRAYPLARADGAARQAGQPDDTAMWRGLAVSSGVMIVYWMLAPIGLSAVVLVPLLGFATAVFVARKAVQAYGGITGDVLGAVCLLSETAMLVFTAMLLPGF